MIEKLPDERPAITRKFQIKYVDESGQAQVLKFYVQVGMYPDGRIGEIFIKGDKVGGLISGALDALAMMISIGLQHGVPLGLITEKLRHHRWGPSGFTGDKDFPSCSSMYDLVAQFLQARFEPDGKPKPIGRVDPTTP